MQSEMGVMRCLSHSITPINSSLTSHSKVVNLLTSTALSFLVILTNSFLVLQLNFDFLFDTHLEPCIDYCSHVNYSIRSFLVDL